MLTICVRDTAASQRVARRTLVEAHQHDVGDGVIGEALRARERDGRALAQARRTRELGQHAAPDDAQPRRSSSERHAHGVAHPQSQVFERARAEHDLGRRLWRSPLDDGGDHRTLYGLDGERVEQVAPDAEPTYCRDRDTIGLRASGELGRFRAQIGREQVADLDVPVPSVQVRLVEETAERRGEPEDSGDHRHPEHRADDRGADRDR